MRSVRIFALSLLPDLAVCTGSFSVQLERSTGRRFARRRSGTGGGKHGLSFLSTDSSEDDDFDVSEPHSSRKSEYYGRIQVGNPVQEFLVVFDTGSGNILIPTTSCKDDACLSHKLYNPKKSKTSQQIAFLDVNSASNNVIDDDFETQGRDVVTITFGTGEVSGLLMKDHICIGDICATTQFVGATSETSQPFELVPFDGILGLSLKQMSENEDFNFFQRLINEKALERNCFAVFFGDENEPSEITFGSYKKERMASTFVWVPVSKPGYWQIEMQDVEINNQRLNLCNGICEVAIDTGTSLLAAPSAIVQQLANTLNIEEDCSNYDSLPPLGFVIAGKLLSLDNEDYVDRSSGDCILGLMSLDMPGDNSSSSDADKPLLIFGDPFLRKFYTVFEVQKDGSPRVGFAYAKHQKTAAAAALRAR